MKMRFIIPGILIIVLSTVFFAVNSESVKKQEQEQLSRDLKKQGSLFELKVGKTAAINHSNLHVQLVKIIEDSRCPTGSSCMMAGKVTAVINILRNTEVIVNSIPLTLTVAQGNLAEKAFEGYLIKLIKVTPYPSLGEKIHVGDYVARITIEKQ